MKALMILALAVSLPGAALAVENAPAAAKATAAPKAPAARKKLLWGDTHLHTSYSFDAFLNNNLSADPDTAYRFAKGAPVIHPYHRARMQRRVPLDFLVVSDHAEFIGGLRDIYRNGINHDDAGLWRSIRNWFVTRTIRNAIDEGEGVTLFRDVLPVSGDPRAAARNWQEDADASAMRPSPSVMRTAWGEIIDAAEAHYEPGRFTSLIGWEWSSVPGGANLHRIVVTDAGGDQARAFQPFSSLDSPFPEDLWQWLEQTSEATGARFLAIPHNSNISKGLMFSDTTLRGDPMDTDYAERRVRWERLVEVTQIKGDSETHPLLAPNDEFADFEPYPFYIQQDVQTYVAETGDYVRPALKTGLQLGTALGVNPFQFGLIGSTDAHTGLSTADENNFGGKMATDSTPETKINPVIAGGSRGWTMSASGMAAVWAEENTREAILSAMRRRETYATTGPRIRVRFFGGWGYTEADLQAVDTGVAYDKGVPMGGTLAGAASEGPPIFLIAAHKDARGANLDRVQVVKGWLDANGESQERVFNAAWSGERQATADGRLPPVGNTVNLTTARYSNRIGAAELSTLWRDPDFNLERPAFYYVRVLEIPTPRHSHFDALALGMAVPNYGATVIQERAYTSPIWY
ncbi:MAG: DUF3604 domain-containing protein, partial [Gammaproteobacteria bacterium]|nr:DUF3604 domain-containing protein [Gammaproteobacteria bacterium]